MEKLGVRGKGCEASGFRVAVAPVCISHSDRRTARAAQCLEDVEADAIKCGCADADVERVRCDGSERTSDVDTDTDTQTQTQTQTQPQTQTQTLTLADTDADTNTDTDMPTDTATDADTETGICVACSHRAAALRHSDAQTSDTATAATARERRSGLTWCGCVCGGGVQTQRRLARCTAAWRASPS
eukprot:2893071-Rhodomonas_salina.2